MMRDFFVAPKSIFIVFIFCGVMIFVFLIRWQVFAYNYYSNIIKSRVTEEVQNGLRGKILASDGSTLAFSEIAYDVHIYKPTLLEIEKQNTDGSVYQTRDEFINKTAVVLNILPDDLRKLMSNDAQNDVIIANKISKEKKDALSSIVTDEDPRQLLLGYDFVQTQKRVYPDGGLAANVLGFLGKDQSGSDIATNGIEQSWDGDLKAQKGYKKLELDAKGNEILSGDRDVLEEKNGNDVQLTINKAVQKILEAKLKEGKETYNAEYATGIIMNPKTGAIIAMANYPSFNPNNYYDTPKENLKYLNNINITEPYEPGSVGKAFTLAAGLNENLVTPDTMLVKSHNGCIKLTDEYQAYNVCVFGKVPRTNMTVRKMIEFSDNIAAYTLAKIVGDENMKSYLSGFGIGEVLNFGLTEESNGFFNSEKKWTDIEFATNSFGQSYGATPIQLTDAYSVFANDGIRVKPKVVEKVTNENGDVVNLPNKMINRPITKETSDTVTDILYNNFNNYVINNYRVSKFKSDLQQYKLAGKTGTAQVPIPGGGYDPVNINSTFIGYDAEGSSFVFFLKLQKPQIPAINNDAGSNAFPLWVETFEEFKDIIGVQKKTK